MQGVIFNGQRSQWFTPFSLVKLFIICYHRLMRGPKQKIFLSFLVIPFLFGPSSLQVADFQTAWVKTVVAIDMFTGKVIGVSDGGTISVMREGRAVKVRLYEIDCPEKEASL
ncbi:MAG: thermonuclease family protein [Candidatus Hodarchaeota archaeon]